MQGNRSAYLLILTLAGSFALTACNKNQEPAPPATPAPSETPAPMAPAPEATPTTPMPEQAAVAVASVDLGSAVGADQKVSTPTTTFAPQDTIYAAVSTTGAASNATLSATWTYQDGQTVNQSSQTIAPTGPAVTTFHISKPEGWPTGNYKVEISLNGTMVMSKDFTVQ